MQKQSEKKDDGEYHAYQLYVSKQKKNYSEPNGFQYKHIFIHGKL